MPYPVVLEEVLAAGEDVTRPGEGFGETRITKCYE
jgi:hypothetical protein